MSLINEMLRDLEARRAGELGNPDLQREIRPLPERRSSSRGMLVTSLILVSLAVAGGGAAWWWQTELGLKKTALPESPALTASVPSPAIAAGTAHRQEMTAPVAEEALRLAASDSIAADRLLPAQMQNPVSKPERPGPAGISLPVKEAGALTYAGKTRSAVAVPGEKAAQKNGGEEIVPAIPTHIEKTPVLGTPRERADAEYRRAQALLAAGGAVAGAVEPLQTALKQDPAYSPARQLLFKVLTESRRIDEAMLLLQEGIDQQPAQIGWAMSLARLQVERGDLTAGERTLARVGAYGAASAEFAGFHGYLLHRQGHFREAAEKYLAATKIAPAEGRWWFGLGQALEAGGRSEDARGAFRRALEAGNLNADLAGLAEQKAR